MKILIMGYGFVGRAVHNSLLNFNHDIYIQDPDKGYLASCDFYDAAFICVPTPTKDFEQDISIVEKCISSINRDYQAPLIVIKSTILPRHAEIFGDWSNVIYVPEFLDQANAYAFNERHIVGTDNVDLAKKYQMLFYNGSRREGNFFITSAKTASMIKYVHNCHGALKVAFFNEVFDICQDEKIDYREMRRILLSINDNVGAKYTQIAADGERGFGGTCFPKDSQAFVHDYECQTLNAALEANKKYNRTN